MRVWSVVFPLIVVLACAPLALAGEPPVPIEGKLLISRGWNNYFMQGSSDNITVLPPTCQPPLYAVFYDISPLGDQVAYTEVGYIPDPSMHIPPGNVWKAGLDGSNPVNLTEPLGLGGISCWSLWSPDGSKIAFNHSDPAPGEFPCVAGFHVWVMNADGSDAHQVTSPGSPPSQVVCWSPDGYRLLCWMTGVGPITIDIDGTDMQTVPYSGDWSPDGSKLACNWTAEDTVDGEHGYWRQLGIVNVDGTDPQVLVQQFLTDADINTQVEKYGWWTPPDPFGAVLYWAGPLQQIWSPRGDRIAFIAAMPLNPDYPSFLEQADVWVYNITTGDLTKITNDYIWDGFLSWNGDNTLPEDPQVTVCSTTVTFSEVTGNGLTTIIRDDDPPALPQGYEFCGEYYNITTTAPYSGPISICMTYKDEDVPGGNEEALALLHYNSTTGQWEDITTSRDMENNIVCGQVDSLSTFGLAVMPISGGFLQPINPDGSSVWKAGRTIPVKFQLHDAVGNPITDAVCHLATWHVCSEIVGTVPESAEAQYADAGGTFRYDEAAGQYIYNLSTKGMATGTWQLRVTAEGWPGFEETVLIGLR